MTQEELNALMILLNRTPMTQPELLWLQGLVSRLVVQAEPIQAEPDIQPMHLVPQRSDKDFQRTSKDGQTT